MVSLIFAKHDSDIDQKDFDAFLAQQMPALRKKYRASRSAQQSQSSHLTEAQQEEQRLMDLRIEALGELRRLAMLRDFQRSKSQVAQEVVTQYQLRAAEEAFRYASETYSSHVENHNLPDRTLNTLEYGSTSAKKHNVWNPQYQKPFRVNTFESK